jgi:hypothetical protein
VGFLLDPELGAGLGERLVNASGPAVHDDQVGTMLGQQPVDDLLGQVGAVRYGLAPAFAP